MSPYHHSKTPKTHNYHQFTHTKLPPSHTTMFSIHALRITHHLAPSPPRFQIQIQIRTLYFCGPKTGTYQPPHQHKWPPQHYWAREKSERKGAGTDEGIKAAVTAKGTLDGKRENANANANAEGNMTGKEGAGAKGMEDGDWEM